MIAIEHVTREINRILAAIGAVEAKASKKAAAAKGTEAAVQSAPQIREKGRWIVQKDRQGGPETGL